MKSYLFLFIVAFSSIFELPLSFPLCLLSERLSLITPTFNNFPFHPRLILLCGLWGKVSFSIFRTPKVTSEVLTLKQTDFSPSKSYTPSHLLSLANLTSIAFLNYRLVHHVPSEWRKGFNILKPSPKASFDMWPQLQHNPGAVSVAKGKHKDSLAGSNSLCNIDFISDARLEFVRTSSAAQWATHDGFWKGVAVLN